MRVGVTSQNPQRQTGRFPYTFGDKLIYLIGKTDAKEGSVRITDTKEDTVRMEQRQYVGNRGAIHEIARRCFDDSSGQFNPEWISFVRIRPGMTPVRNLEHDKAKRQEPAHDRDPNPLLFD